MALWHFPAACCFTWAFEEGGSVVCAMWLHSLKNLHEIILDWLFFSKCTLTDSHYPPICVHLVLCVFEPQHTTPQFDSNTLYVGPKNFLIQTVTLLKVLHKSYSLLTSQCSMLPAWTMELPINWDLDDKHAGRMTFTCNIQRNQQCIHTNVLLYQMPSYTGFKHTVQTVSSWCFTACFIAGFGKVSFSIVYHFWPTVWLGQARITVVFLALLIVCPQVCPKSLECIVTRYHH